MGKQTELFDYIEIKEKDYSINNLVHKLCEKINEISDVNKKIDEINRIRQSIHEVSPLKNHPVDCVLWVKSDEVEGNEYNPNSVAPPEQSLLETSIMEDGYTMSIVGYKPNDKEKEDEGYNVDHVIVDGFHR